MSTGPHILAPDGSEAFTFTPKLSESNEAMWRQAFPNLTPEEFYRRLLPAAAGERLHVSVTESEFGVHFNIYQGKIPNLDKCEGPEMNLLSFTCRPGNHARLGGARFIRTDQHQARRYLHEIVGMLKEARYESLTLGANEVGSYAWAKYGFRPQTQQEWNKLKESIRGEIKNDRLKGPAWAPMNGPVLTEPEKRLADEILSPQSPPEAIWTLVDGLNREIEKIEGHTITPAKRVLFEKYWGGVLPLDDHDEGYKRFTAYTSPERSMGVQHGKS